MAKIYKLFSIKNSFSFKYNDNNELEKICLEYGSFREMKNFVLTILNIDYDVDSKICIKPRKNINVKKIKKIIENNPLLKKKYFLFYNIKKEKELINKFLRKFSVFIINGLKRDFINYFKNYSINDVYLFFLKLYKKDIIDYTLENTDLNFENLNKIAFLIIKKNYSPNDITKKLLNSISFNLKKNYEITKVNDYIFIFDINKY